MKNQNFIICAKKIKNIQFELHIPDKLNDGDESMEQSHLKFDAMWQNNTFAMMVQWLSRFWVHILVPAPNQSRFLKT